MCWPTFLFLWFSAISLALLEERFVAFDNSAGAVPIHDAAIVFASDDTVGVRIAVDSIVGDIEQITGKRPAAFGVTEENATVPNFGRNIIIAGTLDSSLLKGLIRTGKLEISDIKGKWETFKTTIIEQPWTGVDKGLLIAGSDKRGVMFGLYTLAEQCGQSPLHWWADVPAEKHKEIYALPVTTIHGEPSVRYRGLFINDEAPALTGWWSKVNGENHYPLNTEFYRHVFDMLLRLKANFMWPAMWKSSVPKPGNVFFTDDPGNIQLANDYGIVISTSHHEPMQRATNEWNETMVGPWDWEENKANVTAFMEDGIRRTRMNESYYTLGMRGPGDGPIQGDDPIGVLEDVFQTQQEMFSNSYGNASTVNKVWTIYKEVMTYYAAGLTPPDDVTLMFTDDNWGNIQRLPLANETTRSGGIGLYYHLEYVGVPKSYKWQNTNNLPKVYKELSQAYERGADRIWVINVADIKPLEVPFGFVMDLAWNTSSISFESIPRYLNALATREFGSEQAEEISSIIMEHSRLIGRRKYEATQAKTYSVLHYNENERVLSEWRSLAQRVSSVAGLIPGDRKDAFWHHVQYPVHSGYTYHAVVLGLGRNQQIGFEKRNSANAVASEVLQHFESDFDLIEQYDSIAGGKWTGILAQPKYDQYGTASRDWSEPTKDVVTGLWYVQLRQNSTYSFGNLGIYAEGCESAQNQGRSLPSVDESAPTGQSASQRAYAPILPIMDPYGKGVWNVDLFHRGDYRVPIKWSTEIPFDWIVVSPSSGEISQAELEQRLNVSIIWDKVPSGFQEEVSFKINYNTVPWFDLVRLPIVNYHVPDGFTGFPETSGVISIESPHFQRASEGDVSFASIPYLGTRSDSGSLALRPYKGARDSITAAQAAWVEYDIYLYNNSFPLNATIYVNSALDTDPTLKMQFSLTLDANDTGIGWTRLLGDPAKPGDTPPGWSSTVADYVWTRNITFGNITAGKHTLRWQANSPEVYLEKIVLNTRGGLKSSYLGPSETTWLQ
ncbi:uncharacterized protein JN550_009117 [Neoarthrinium moseri]|uniref:uncharacterized protein n=1 Tax=Neoarthrinium moseri TaxID=1658444 RepID=UPI001FDC4181|nr:uncharacterized protein JN550_009117 [Neoarthrinium moseri]KAI1864097.1 hypothetical protein JN550_009117 [Neoarthrinium moseri]